MINKFLQGYIIHEIGTGASVWSTYINNNRISIGYDYLYPPASIVEDYINHQTLIYQYDTTQNIGHQINKGEITDTHGVIRCVFHKAEIEDKLYMCTMNGDVMCNIILELNEDSMRICDEHNTYIASISKSIRRNINKTETGLEISNVYDFAFLDEYFCMAYYFSLFVQFLWSK